MSCTLSSPAARSSELREWAAREGLPLEIVIETDAPVRIAEGAVGKQSSSTVLQAGGWIACSAAFESAGRLGISPRQIGALLDHLDIRIRACQLGCFE